MNLNLNKHWSIVFFKIGIIIMFGFVIYNEVKIHYFLEFNGVVIKKEILPPKKMPNLVVKGTNQVFPTWKWKGLDFNDVQIGDSIVKRKFEQNAYLYKKNKNGTFRQVVLNYWIF